MVRQLPWQFTKNDFLHQFIRFANEEAELVVTQPKNVSITKIIAAQRYTVRSGLHS
jgi:hypothetical protein